VPDVRKIAFSPTKILLPIDFSASTEAAVEAAAGLAQQFHAGVHLVHIIPETPDFNGSDFFPETAVLQERREVIEKQLCSFKDRLELQGVSASSSIETGNDIVGNLIRIIKLEQIDMVVISTHGLSGWRPFVFGSIAEQVIKQVDCTLLLIKSGEQLSAAEAPVTEIREGSVVPHMMASKHVGARLPGLGIGAQERLDRSAEALAEHGGRTEQAYDQSHSLFTK
jgi:nucleotide-binding universal stress UspA family protein